MTDVFSAKDQEDNIRKEHMVVKLCKPIELLGSFVFGQITLQTIEKDLAYMPNILDISKNHLHFVQQYQTSPFEGDLPLVRSFKGNVIVSFVYDSLQWRAARGDV